MSVTVEVSYGELLDKVTILELKQQKISDPVKRTNINRELVGLSEIVRNAVPDSPELRELKEELFEINSQLWQIEDDIRDRERKKLFDEIFIELARKVYFTNDRRSDVKYRINSLLGSQLVEEKSYQAY